MLLGGEAKLVIAARDGDPRAFGTLVEAHQRDLVRFLNGVCRDRDLALDLAQDTLLNAWRRLGSLQDPNKFKSWVMKIGYNAFLGHLRRKRVEAQYAEPSDRVVDSSHAEAESDLERLLQYVSDGDRLMLALCYAAELTFVEIAEMLGEPVGTVKSRVRRARMKIAEAIGKEESRNGRN